MPNRKLPDNDRLIEWLSEGKTHKQIAELAEKETGQSVTAVAVRVAVSRLGLAERRPTYSEWVPWSVRAVHRHQYPYVMLCAYARYKEAGEDPAALPDDLRVRLFNWLAKMSERKTVVTYDRESGCGYADAQIGEFLIRRPAPGSRAGARRTG